MTYRLKHGDHAPCLMETAGQEPDWKTRSRIVDIRGRL
jgi:hypothetical protein